MVYSFDHRLVEPDDRHIAQGESAKHDRGKDETPHSIEKGSTPSGQIAVIGNNDRLTIKDGKFVWRERDVKVS